MAKSKNELLQGTLDILILKTLSLEPLHGWAISQRIHQVSGNEFLVNQGSLYPALHRLERRGWIAAETGTAENNRQVKIYRLSAAGRRQLLQERASWDRFTSAMARVLES
ncbi:MAG: PadR family transcriptional regulator [Acidobacteria bacterium]|nr:PadR family transcriptional regulator [Acidobacteriota bacterium]